MEDKKPILFTGITPTGTLTLGHYCGVINYILSVQEKYQIIIMIADLHAITVPKQDFDFAEASEKMAALLYACGLKEKNCKIFIQSSIKEHLELFHFLSPYVTVGKLENMIQYKEKKKEKETGSLSLISYPVLMAADAFLYDVDLIIIGEDQKQHSELITQIANKINNLLKEKTIKVPRFVTSTIGAKILSLKNPLKKMSKSENNCLFLLDDFESIKKKIMSAKTDGDNLIIFDPIKKPGISNLMNIYATLRNETIEKTQQTLTETNYAQFKEKIIELLQEKTSEIQNRYHSYLPKINDLLKTNHYFIKEIAKKKINAIKKKLKIFSDF